MVRTVFKMANSRKNCRCASRQDDSRTRFSQQGCEPAAPLMRELPPMIPHLYSVTFTGSVFQSGAGKYGDVPASVADEFFTLKLAQKPARQKVELKKTLSMHGGNMRRPMPPPVRS